MYTYIYTYIYVYMCTCKYMFYLFKFIRAKHTYKHIGRRFLGNALTTSVTTMHNLHALRVVTKALTSSNASPSTTIRNHESIRVVVSVKARGYAAADAIVGKMTTDNINEELAKVDLPAASVLVYAHSAGELLFARFAHRLLHVVIGHNIHT